MHVHEEIDNILKNELLTDEQQDSLKTVQWLVNGGARASGRTYLLAVAFIRKAVITGERVRVWDHTIYSKQHAYHLYEMMDQIIAKLNAYLKNPLRLEIHKNSESIFIHCDYKNAHKLSCIQSHMDALPILIGYISSLGTNEAAEVLRKWDRARNVMSDTEKPKY